MKYKIAVSRKFYTGIFPPDVCTDDHLFENLWKLHYLVSDRPIRARTHLLSPLGKNSQNLDLASFSRDNKNCNNKLDKLQTTLNSHKCFYVIIQQ